MTNNYEEQYLALVEDVLRNGDFVEDRTGTGTYSSFGVGMKIDLSKGFPLLTTKKINSALPIGELLWMLSGSTDLPSLRKYQNKPKDSHTIWSDDFEKYKYSEERLVPCNGEQLGRIYGQQLRETYHLDVDYNPVLHDQLITLIDNIKAVKKDRGHPMARRLRCSWWNPYDHTTGDKKWCALAACHTDFQCLVRDNKLNLHFNLRSNDLFLGKPFNTCFYATLCHILARLVGLEVGELSYFAVDAHIYSNHVDQLKEQLSREIQPLPELILPEFNNLEDLLGLSGEDFKLEGYTPAPFIKAPQAS